MGTEIIKLDRDKGGSIKTEDKDRYRSSLKRKASDDFSVGGRSGDSKLSMDRKKKRFIWPPELHSEFVMAVFDLGLRSASSLTVMDSIQKADISATTIDYLLKRYRIARKIESPSGNVLPYTANSPQEANVDIDHEISLEKTEARTAVATAGHVALSKTNDDAGEEINLDHQVVVPKPLLENTKRFRATLADDERNALEILDRGAIIMRRQLDLAARSDDLLRKFQSRLNRSLEAQRELVLAVKKCPIPSYSNEIALSQQKARVIRDPSSAKSNLPAVQTSSINEDKPLLAAQSITTASGHKNLATSSLSQQNSTVVPTLTSSRGQTPPSPPPQPRTHGSHRTGIENISRQPTAVLVPSIQATNTESMGHSPIFPRYTQAHQQQSGIDVGVAAASVAALSGRGTAFTVRATTAAAHRTSPQPNLISPSLVAINRQSIHSEMEARMSMHREMLHHKSDQLTLFDENEDGSQTNRPQSSNQPDAAWHFDDDMDVEIFDFLGAP